MNRRLRNLVLPGVGVVIFATSALLGLALTNTGEQRGRLTAFWQAVRVEATEGESFDTVGDLSRASDLVLVGHITSVTKGREWLANPENKHLDDPWWHMMSMARFASVTVEVDQPIKGAVDGTVELEVFLPADTELKQLEATISDQQGLYFLHEKQEPKLSGVYRLMSIDGSFLAVDGNKVEALDFDESPVAKALDGQSLDTAVSMINETTDGIAP